MPIIIPNDLPAAAVLASENIFTMTEFRAAHQDIRPLRIGIVNLMPTKVVTETQLMRLLGNTPIQMEIVLIQLETHESKNTPHEYLDKFYVPFSKVENDNFDGLIITGAPVENMAFEEVSYWKELEHILAWSRAHGFATFHICWGAQAALYKHYGIPKHALPEKRFGVFKHRAWVKNHKLLKGFDDAFYIPNSRHTEVRLEDVLKISELEVVAVSEESGVGLIVSRDGREVYAMGHSEYDPLTLAAEYFRDVQRGVAIDKPKHYFPNDDVTQAPLVNWRGHAYLLFQNWLNYYVYQETPYDLRALENE
ncbi:MAG: homoserine O-succinyltransferase/O-acetyltransferase [Clostridiales bacterium]|jgi:homoserine O-succinyltransferase|nr:homoserine O-succinyltransferase/O-acetyltransferase [Clostridiales bacterium]